jgi:hypothetical protein
MGNTTSTQPQPKINEYYSEKEINDLIQRTILRKQPEVDITDTLHFNECNLSDDELMVGGARKKPTQQRNRYDRYQAGGYDSDLYNELNSEFDNVDVLKKFVTNNEDLASKYMSELNNVIDDTQNGGADDSDVYNELSSDDRLTTETLKKVFNMQGGADDSDEYNELTSETIGFNTAMLENALNMHGGAEDSDEYNELDSETININSSFWDNLLNMKGGNCPCESGNNISIGPQNGGSKKEESDDETIDDEDDDEEDEDLASELEEDIDELDSDESEQSRSHSTRSSQSRSSRSSRTSKSSRSSKKNKSSKRKSHKMYNSEYSMTNSASSTINIVPFYSTPSDSEYYSHLKNKRRFA